MSIVKKCAWYAKAGASCALVSSVTLIVSGAFAQDFTKRAYVTGGFGTTLVEPESSTDSLTISDNTDSGAHIGIGVDISRLLSLEVYAATLGEARVDFLGTDAGTVDYTVFGYSVLGYLFNSRSGLSLGDKDTEGLFRREGASLYGRIGIGHLQNDSTNVEYRRDNPNHLAFGLGLEYGWENGFALRTEFMSLDTDARYFNVSLVKRFGSAGAAAVPALAAAVETPVENVSEPVLPVVPAGTGQKIFKPIVPPNIYFEFNRAELSSEVMAMLDTFADQFAGNDLRVKIEGHTDSIASEAFNARLSVRRAEAVADYLVGKGIDSGKIDTVGFGETRPISSNDTEEGRSLNRRADIFLK